MFVMYVCVSVSIMAKGLSGKRTVHEANGEVSQRSGILFTSIGCPMERSSYESVSLRNGIYQGFDMLTIKSMA